LENPRAYAGKTVSVSGEVTQTLSFVFIKYFKVRKCQLITFTSSPFFVAE